MQLFFFFFSSCHTFKTSVLLCVFMLERYLTSKQRKGKNMKLHVHSHISVATVFSHSSTDPLKIYVRYSRDVSSKFCQVFHQQTSRFPTNTRNVFLKPYTDFLK